MKHLPFLVVMLLTSMIATGSTAATYVVQPDGNGDFPTIQAAIDAAVDGDIIELTDGVFIEDGNRDIDFRGKAITVRSQSGDAEQCIIDCQGTAAEPHRGFYFQGGETSASVVEALTVRGGFAPYDGPPWILSVGGGILCDGSSPTVTDCILVDNTADFEGGGMRCYQCSPLITGCIFSGNFAVEYGGALACWAASPTLSDCVFSGNYGRGGGGIHCREDPSPTITSCSFSENTSRYGSGMALKESSPTVAGCMFINNSAELGCTGVSFAQSFATFVNCTFYGAASSTGDATISCFQSSPALDNTILAFNAVGEAVACDDAESNPELTCCALYGNVGGDWVDCIADQEGVHGNFSSDPLFCRLAWDIRTSPFRLHANSPCLPGNHPYGYECGLIGALGQGCGDAVGAILARAGAKGEVAAMRTVTWGSMKTGYRR